MSLANMTATTHFVPAGWGNPERTNRKTEGQIDGDKNTTKAKPIIDLEAELKRLNLSITELAMDNFKLRVEIRELKEQNEVLTKGLEELRKTVEKLKPRQHNESRGLFPDLTPTFGSGPPGVVTGTWRPPARPSSGFG